jgi:hypothetical protein
LYLILSFSTLVNERSGGPRHIIEIEEAAEEAAMSIVKDLARPRGPLGKVKVASSGSIREVSLIGKPPEGWADGQRVDWAGRAYRVVGDLGRYAHLRSASDEARTSG